jgi:DNA invertase Pin-like site-specific DNA recombinase
VGPGAVSNATAITTQHRERLALIYLRQSTPMQVREHRESTARQYAMAEEAIRLGWGPSSVITIDADLGHSARAGSVRPGFAEVVQRVCLGEVGAIFGLEISRLARSSADLQRLLEFCSLTDTLIIDAEGVYDLRQLNDRLIVGMKEQMAVVELHVLASRLQESKRAAARRGELRVPLPVGYVYDADGHTVLDPDDGIRAAIADVFATFVRTGSAYGVVDAFRDRPFPKRVVGGPWTGDLRWGLLTHDRVLRVLTNPTYTGAYVSGRYQARRVVDPDGTIRTRVSIRRAEDWAVLIRDHHPAYVSWDTFVANRQRLAANSTRRGAHPPREGTALLQGIILCGTCGRRMTVCYSRGRASYHCLTGRAGQTHRAACRGMYAAAVDAAVVQCVLARINPQEIALALAAVDEVTDRRARDLRARELTVERARYETARAERAFHQCEPENRLVARSLEQRWEQQLRLVAEAERALATAQATAAPLPARPELEALASDLPRLWHASTTSDKDRKRLLRAVVADITVQSAVGDSSLRLGLRWQSGAAETLIIPRPIGRRTAPGAIDLVRHQVDRSDDHLVAALNAAGFTTTTGDAFTVRDVRALRRREQLWPPPTPDDGCLPASDVARRLGVDKGVVYYWLEHGHVDGHRDVHGRWRVAFSADVEAACRQRMLASSRITLRIPSLAPGGAV